MKKSLTIKMFLTLFTSFVVLTGFIILFIFIYFNYSYRNIKISNMTEAINEFAEQYKEENWNEFEFYKELSDFNDRNNISLSVYSYAGAYYSEEANASMKGVYLDDPEVDSNYLITVLIDGVYYDMFISAENYLKIPEFSSPNNSETFILKGYVYNDNMILPSAINDYAFENFNPHTLLADNPTAKVIEAQAQYVSMGLFSNIIKDESAADIIENPFPLVGESTSDLTLGYDNNTIEASVKNNVTYIISEIPYTDLEQVYFSTQVLANNQLWTLDAYMSLHSVSEIADTMAAFLPWFLLGAVILALLVSLFYSRTVSRPIIKITKAADGMAAMDFDIKSDINRTDELGMLSNSLNTLSSNLNNAMTELVEKNKKLADDYARKEKEEESRKEFIANASHELKTPLGVIKGYTEALRDGVRKDKHDYYMDVILDETSRMDSLLEEMMLLSKFEAGAQILKHETIDLDKITEIVTTGLGNKAAKRKLTFDVKSPLGNAYGDKCKIHQVMYNLLSNSVKYATPETSISIETITTEGKTTIYIKNDCAQLSQEELDRLWERFYKTDKSHNRGNEGSGLGLAIVKSILEQHNAEFGVYNTNKGVCFFYSMPLSQ